jgi:hypothetical protein
MVGDHQWQAGAVVSSTGGTTPNRSIERIRLWRSFAKEIVELLLDCSGRLDESVARAKKVCSEAEFLAYRNALLTDAFSSLRCTCGAANRKR